MRGTLRIFRIGFVFWFFLVGAAGSDSGIRLTTSFKAPVADAEDYFGSGSIAIDGDTLVVGAWGDDSSAPGINGDQSDNSMEDAGAAHVYVRSGDTWEHQAYLKPSQPHSKVRFGHAVAISGDTILVGSPGGGSERAYVFVRDGDVWSEQQRLQASDLGSGDGFGSALAISGDTIIIGAPAADSNAFEVNGSGSDGDPEFGNSGTAYIFVRSGTNWTQQATINIPDPALYSTTNLGAFGYGVDVFGDTAVVCGGGTREHSYDCQVIVYERVGDQWSRATRYFTRDATFFGRSKSVSLSEDWLVIGDEFGGSGGGRAQSFDPQARNGGNSLPLLQTLEPAFPNHQGAMGLSASVSRDLLVVGIPFDDSSATEIDGDEENRDLRNAGAAYVYVNEGGQWNRRAYLKAPDANFNNNLGMSVAVSGRTLAVGASSLGNSGAVYIFDLEAEKRIYVNAAAPLGGDGESWSSALRYLQDGIAEATSDSLRGGQIWVAGGVYAPDDGVGQIADSREATFSMLPNLTIYGGFRGDESDLAERDPVGFPTVLSGDILG